MRRLLLIYANVESARFSNSCPKISRAPNFRAKSRAMCRANVVKIACMLRRALEAPSDVCAASAFVRRTRQLNFQPKFRKMRVCKHAPMEWPPDTRYMHARIMIYEMSEQTTLNSHIDFSIDS